MSRAEFDQLRNVPLFVEADEAQLVRIAEVATAFEVPAGRVLAERGQPGSGMFVLLEGTVEVDVPGLDPIELGPGDFVGELSLLTESDRLARVRALTPVRGLAIGRAAFHALINDEPRIALAMLPVLARRLAAVESR
jgi:CRP-like cAMP-binding protein